MAARVHRHEISVFVGPVTFALTGDPLHVEASPNRDTLGDSIVEFWFEHRDDVTPVARTFEVFGTGYPLPEGARWWGTTARTAEGFVWHLYEIPSPEVA